MAQVTPELLKYLESVTAEDIEKDQKAMSDAAMKWINGLNEGLVAGMVLSLKNIPGANNIIWGMMNNPNNGGYANFVRFQETDKVTLVEDILYIDYWKCYSDKHGTCYVPARLFNKES